MIKVNIFNMFTTKGKITRDNEYGVEREVKKLNNIQFYSATLYRSKHTNPTIYKEYDVVYLIVNGRASIETENKIVKCHKNDIIFIPYNETHIIVNTGDIHLQYLIMKEKI